MIIADTDVLIDFLADRNPGADRVATEIERGALRTTVVSRFELLCGARTVRQERAIQQLLDAVPAIPLDAGAADRAAQARKRLEKNGEPIGMADSLIAGVVLAGDATLLTRNHRHFGRVAGLKLAEWDA